MIKFLINMLSLKFFDIYSDPLHFTFDKKEKINTNIGGCFIILNISILILLSFYLGKNFYFHTDPIIMEKNKIIDEHVIRKFKTDNLTIAVKIDDQNGEDFEIEGKIFFKAFHEIWGRTNKGYNLLIKTELKFEKCVENQYKFLQNLSDISKWYCIELKGKNISLGGKFYESPDEHSLKILVSNCPNEKYENNSCSSLKKLNLTNPLYVNFLHPTVYLNLGEKDPLINVFKNIFTNLESSSTKFYNCNYNYGTFLDDKGWIIQNFVTNISFFSSEDCLLDFKKINEQEDEQQVVDYIVKSIYLSKLVVETRRSYMKIQELIPILNSSFSILNFIFINIYSFFFLFEKKKLFLEKIWLESEKIEEKSRKKSNLKENFNLQNEEDSNISIRKLIPDQSRLIKNEKLNNLKKPELEKMKNLKKNFQNTTINKNKNKKLFEDIISNNYSNKIVGLYNNNSLYTNKNKNVINRVNTQKENKRKDKLASNNYIAFPNTFSLLINLIHLQEISSDNIKCDLKLNYGFCKYNLKRFFKYKKPDKREHIYRIMKLYEENIEEPFEAFNYFKLYYRMKNFFDDLT